MVVHAPFSESIRARIVWRVGVAALLAATLAVPLGIPLLTTREPGRLVCHEPALEWHCPDPSIPYDPTSEAPEVTYHLRNDGDHPVRILKVESSCGCSVPRVEPATIPPGGRARVDVDAKAIQIGYQDATIALLTDSSESPRVDLRLRIIGARRPPYLVHSFGELEFRPDVPDGRTRRVYASTFQATDEPVVHPRLSCDLPFVKIGVPAIVDEHPSLFPGAVERRFAYEIRLDDPPSSSRFSGTLLVQDPWDKKVSHSLRVHGSSVPALRASPSRLLVPIKDENRVQPTTATILVWSKDREENLAVTFEPPDDHPAEVTSVAGSEGGRAWRIELAIRLELPVDSEFIAIIRGGTTGHGIRVPVALRRAGP